MKKFAIISIAISVILFINISSFAEQTVTEQVPEFEPSYIVYEATTDTVLDGQNEFQPQPIASITKEMTLILAAEAINANPALLTQKVTVSKHASSAEGATIWLREGEKMRMSDLLKSVVIASANDAAVAVAEQLAGTEPAFVEKMNAKARALGMFSTKFINATGLDQPGGEGNNGATNGISTPKDVALMTAELFRAENYKIYKEYFCERLSSVRTGTKDESQLLNTNKLLGKTEGLLGGKTGSLDGKYGFTAAAERGGMFIITVPLNETDELTRFARTRTLFESAFAANKILKPDFDKTKLIPLKVKNGVRPEIDVVPETLHNIIVPKNAEPEYTYYLPKQVTAPIYRGQPLGTITMTAGGKTVLETYIVASNDCELLTFSRSVQIVLKKFLGL